MAKTELMVIPQTVREALASEPLRGNTPPLLRLPVRHRREVKLLVPAVKPGRYTYRFFSTGAGMASRDKVFVVQPAGV